MANETPEPRALNAALAGPQFVSRGAGMAMHVADRHVERWAPETTANRVRPLRSLGFVDRLIAPWIETAQRSASLRMFSQMRASGANERAGNAVSWVFPRPWYQDELDWMTAARQTAQLGTPAMLTTRGTYVAPQQQASQPQQRQAMPAALYEFVAPSLSLARPDAAAMPVQGIGYGGDVGATRAIDAYSPLVSLASIQAAQLVARSAPVVATRTSPTLRALLGAIVERAAIAAPVPTRSSLSAPELVTPPAPRPERGAMATEAAPASPELRIADEVAEQHQRIVELQRVSRQVAIREQAAQIAEQRASAATASAPAASAAGAATVAAEAVAREAEIRARISDVRQATAAQRAELVAAERARTEAQIAQRVAERTTARRMHEQARIEAAVHARVEPTAAVAPTSPAAPTTIDAPARQVPTEVLAAIAALPPELQRALQQRPERAMHAIAELGESLRTTELLARNASAGRAIEVTRGPRLVMPVGLGGLVATVDRATPFAAPSAAAPMAMPTFASTARTAAPAARAAAPTTMLRAPTLPWVARGDGGVTHALGATVASTPATLQHVAWADRWLARFAGAAPQSLAMLTATGSTNRDVRMQALADAAPGAVFVAPMFDSERAPVREGRVEVPRFASADRAPTAPDATGPILVDRSPTAPASVERYDDTAATPDDVFAAIAASASRRRVPAGAGATTARTPAAQPARPDLAHPTYVDGLAHAAPIAPGAGLSAQLSASPFASALQHIVPLAASRTFDVRALFGGEIAASYLAGLFAESSHEVATPSAMPSWARGFELAAIGSTIGGAAAADGATRIAPEWDAAYVVPETDRGAAATADAAPLDERTDPTAPSSIAQAGSTTATAIAAELAPLTTLRSALLSWQLDDRGGFASPTTIALDTAANAGVAPMARPVFAPSSPVYAQHAHLDAMSLPMLGDHAADTTSTYAAPGMVGSRAHAWSVAQERSSADLAFDFVTPELVLAARVYGFGPAEAIQAARLAIAGPTQLTAMAGAVDRTFVQAMALESERRSQTITTAHPTTADGVRVVARPTTITAAAGAMPSLATTAPGETAAFAPAAAASPIMSAPPPTSSPSTTAFGIARRSPRGAFLWPSAAVAALGLDAAAPDGAMAMTVAALELLAAQAVAEIGTYAAQPESRAAAASTGAMFDDDTVGAPSFARTAAGTTTSTTSTTSTPATTAASSPTASPPAPGREPTERDVLDTVAALVPTTRRARFDALYLALGQSVTGRDWSPAARAARALALVGRGDEGAALSAHERAATVWDVLPVVYALGASGDFGAPTSATSSTSGTSSAASSRASASGRTAATRGGRTAAGGTAGFVPDFTVDARPGLAGLSARAGEALGSYVTPTQAAAAFASASSESSSSSSSSSSTSSASSGAVLRAPTVMPEFVRTGSRPSGRHGGGETEIPAWFEQAARRMFDERSSGSSMSDGISLSDLTLIQNTPQAAVAASERTVSSPTPAATSSHSPAAGGAGGDIDIEKLASDVYRSIIDLMDHARARNGEPYV